MEEFIINHYLFKLFKNKTYLYITNLVASRI